MLRYGLVSLLVNRRNVADVLNYGVDGKDDDDGDNARRVAYNDWIFILN